MEEKFLELYKEMEGLLKEKYMGEAARSGVVMKFINSLEGKRFREKLNTCREIRNILAHSPDIRGEAPLIPSAGAVAFMEEVVAYLKQPPTVLENATPAARLVTANLQSEIQPLIHRMQKEGFSHIPILDEKQFYGMFSTGIFFSLALDKKECLRAQKIEDVKEYLAIERHACETFAFVDKDMTVDEARELLNRARGPHHKRLAALLITEHGRPQEPLLGLATPWDVMMDDVPLKRQKR